MFCHNRSLDNACLFSHGPWSQVWINQQTCSANPGIFFPEMSEIIQTFYRDLAAGISCSVACSSMRRRLPVWGLALGWYLQTKMSYVTEDLQPIWNFPQARLYWISKWLDFLTHIHNPCQSASGRYSWIITAPLRLPVLSGMDIHAYGVDLHKSTNGRSIRQTYLTYL